MRVSYLLWKGLCHPYRVQALSLGLPPRPCLLFQVQAVTLLHPLVSIIFYPNYIFFCKHCVHKAIYHEFPSITSALYHTYFWFLFLAESLLLIIVDTPSSCQEATREDTGEHQERREDMGEHQERSLQAVLDLI